MVKDCFVGGRKEKLVLKTLYLKNKIIKYDGSQLRSHWILENFNLLGDSLIAFCGPCEVSLEKMVDLIDVKKRAKIYSKNMLHFISEFFNLDLEKTILYQRLLVSLVQEEINLRTKKYQVKRKGNDLYDDKYKISVSIATLSPVSSLLHLGINIISQETPVLTKGLSDYKIKPEDFAKSILKKFALELKTIYYDKCKVKGVP